MKIQLCIIILLVISILSAQRDEVVEQCPRVLGRFRQELQNRPEFLRNVVINAAENIISRRFPNVDRAKLRQFLNDAADLSKPISQVCEQYKTQIAEVIGQQ